MFSDKSAFRLIRGGQITMRRPKFSARYDAKFTVKTLKHPDSVVVWNAFSVEKGRDVLACINTGLIYTYTAISRGTVNVLWKTPVIKLCVESIEKSHIVDDSSLF